LADVNFLIILFIFVFESFLIDCLISSVVPVVLLVAMDPEVGDHQENLADDEHQMETTTEVDGGRFLSIFKSKDKKKSKNDVEVQPSAEKDETAIPSAAEATVCSSGSDDRQSQEESSGPELIPVYVLSFLQSQILCVFVGVLTFNISLLMHFVLVRRSDFRAKQYRIDSWPF